MENLSEDQTDIQEQQPEPAPSASQKNWRKIRFLVTTALFLTTAGVFGFYVSKARKVEKTPQPTSVPILTPIPTPTPKLPVISPTPTLDPTADWKTYTDKFISFRYPQDWIAETPQIFGSRTEVDFKYNLTTVLALFTSSNHNNSTGKSFATLNEFLGNGDDKAKDINVGSYQAKRITSEGEEGHVVPYEKVVLFTPDQFSIVSLYYQADYYNKSGASEVLNQILSTFQFLE